MGTSLESLPPLPIAKFQVVTAKSFGTMTKSARVAASASVFGNLSGSSIERVLGSGSGSGYSLALVGSPVLLLVLDSVLTPVLTPVLGLVLLFGLFSLALATDNTWAE